MSCWMFWVRPRRLLLLLIFLHLCSTPQAPQCYSATWSHSLSLSLSSIHSSCWAPLLLLLASLVLFYFFSVVPHAISLPCCQVESCQQSSRSCDSFFEKKGFLLKFNLSTKSLVSPNMCWPPSIRNFFKFQNVFITGGTGFLGKAVIEKILRGCPGVGTVYLLIRDKPGVRVEKRFQDFCNNEVCPLGLS